MNKMVLFLSKMFFIVLVLILLIFAANCYFNKNVSYTNNLSEKNILIVYFSHSSHTEKIANMIKQLLHCDIKNIKSEEYENKTIVELNNIVTEQIHKKYFPKINDINILDYNVIFVGSPVWKGDLSLPVKSFLINNDFNNKTIVPFYTFGGFVNKSKLDKEIKELSRNNKVLPSFLTVYYKFAFIEYRLTLWLNKIDLK